MSAALTHVAMGLLLGMALRIRWRHLPLVAALALAPDLDHAGLFLPALSPWLLARGTLTNVFLCLAAPVALAAWMRWKDKWPAWQPLAFAAPLILASHLLLDMLPLDPLGAVGGVALLYPLTTTLYTIDVDAARSLSPATYTTITMMFLLLAAMTALTLWAMERKRGAAPVAALTGAWLLVIPAASLAGAVIPMPAWTAADLALEAPRVRLPEGALLAIVHDLGGAPVGGGALRLEVRQGSTLVLSVTNPQRLDLGGAWIVDAPLPGDARTLGALTLTLVHARTGHVYATAKAGLEKGHLDLPLQLDAATPPTRLEVRNAATLTILPGTLRARATQGGREVANLTNDAPLGSGGVWTLPAAGTLAGGAVTWELRAADDGWLYDRQDVPASL